MQDKDDKLDQLFKQKFKEYKIPVSDRVLANIKKELPAENRKTGFGMGFWALLVILLAGATTGGYFVASPYFSNTKAVAQLPANSGTATNKMAVPAASAEKEQGNTTNAVAGSPVAKGGSEKETKDAGNKSPDNTLTENKTTTAKTASSPEKKKENNSSSISKSLASNKANAKQPNRNETKTQEVNNEEAKTEKQNKTSEEVLASSSEIKTEKKEETVSDGSATEKKTDAPTEIKKDSVQEDALAKLMDSINCAYQPPPTNYTKEDDKKLSFFAGISGGPSFSYRTLTTGNNPGAANRNQNETSQTTFNAGIDVGATFKDKWFVNTGIRINNKTEKYHISAFLIKLDTSYTPQYDTSGNITGYNTILSLSGGRVEYMSVHKYQFVSVPVMLGYKFTIKDKLFIAPSVGVSIDYLLSATSAWIDTRNLKVITYSKENGKFNTISVSGKINLAIGWNINKKWSLMLEPGYTRSLTSIYKKGDEMKLYPYSYDVNLGVRYRF